MPAGCTADAFTTSVNGLLWCMRFRDWILIMHNNVWAMNRHIYTCYIHLYTYYIHLYTFTLYQLAWNHLMYNIHLITQCFSILHFCAAEKCNDFFLCRLQELKKNEITQTTISYLLKKCGNFKFQQSISALFKFANALALALFAEKTNPLQLALTCEKKNALPLAVIIKRAALFLALFDFFHVFSDKRKFKDW